MNENPFDTFANVNDAERVGISYLDNRIDELDRKIALAGAIAGIATSSGWKDFTQKLEDAKTGVLQELIKTQDPHQKFRLSGKMEALGSLLQIVQGSALELELATRERKELLELRSGMVTGSRLNPAGRIWKKP